LTHFHCRAVSHISVIRRRRTKLL